MGLSLLPNMSRTESTPIPRVALLSAVSSRHTNKPNANDLALFRVSTFWAEICRVCFLNTYHIFHACLRNQYLLPSFLRTLECGYKYQVIIGYDAGDLFYDSDEGQDSVRQWRQVRV
jgi:hypothetical protein